jgi:hypothetical protein
MNKLITYSLLFLAIVLTQSCEKENTGSDVKLVGDQSAMSVVGTTVTSSSSAIPGVTNLTASVASLANGVSSYSGSATITNTAIKNILSNFPGITINGNTVTATGFKFKQTTDGIESFVDMGPGIIVKYDSNVGDTYPVGDTGRTRTVTSKSTTDDFYYGGMMIKTMKIEEPTPQLKSTSSLGVTKVTYWANHRFGLVAVQYDFADGTSAKLPVYSSTTNN